MGRGQLHLVLVSPPTSIFCFPDSWQVSPGAASACLDKDLEVWAESSGGVMESLGMTADAPTICLHELSRGDQLVNSNHIRCTCGSSLWYHLQDCHG